MTNAATSIETYANARKDEYRETVVRHMIGERKANNLRGMMLTGPDGGEIPVWRDHGLRDSKMVLVDCDSNCLADSKRIHEIKRAKSYNMTIGESAATMVSDGVTLDLANLDYPTFLHEKTLDEIESFFAAGILAKGARVCVTYLKARDKYACDLTKIWDCDRNEILRDSAEFASDRKVSIVESGQYQGGKTGHSTMAWVVLEIE